MLHGYNRLTRLFMDYDAIVHSTGLFTKNIIKILIIYIYIIKMHRENEP
jgi:hypothetical protein